MVLQCQLSVPSPARISGLPEVWSRCVRTSDRPSCSKNQSCLAQYQLLERVPVDGQTPCSCESCDSTRLRPCQRTRDVHRKAGCKLLLVIATIRVDDCAPFRRLRLALVSDRRTLASTLLTTALRKLGPANRTGESSTKAVSSKLRCT